MAAPGKKNTHQAPLVKNLYESASMAPHSGAGGWAPSPRKPSAAPSRMAKAMESVVCTIRGGRLLGTMWLSSTRAPLQPSPWAASTNSCSHRASAAPRLRRA